jgi:hypothetical protein
MGAWQNPGSADARCVSVEIACIIKVFVRFASHRRVSVFAVNCVSIGISLLVGMLDVASHGSSVGRDRVGV